MYLNKVGKLSIANSVAYLTLTRVVFEYVKELDYNDEASYLTLTRVVFEFY